MNSVIKSVVGEGQKAVALRAPRQGRGDGQIVHARVGVHGAQEFGLVVVVKESSSWNTRIFSVSSA